MDIFQNFFKMYCKRFGILVVYICKKDKEKPKWKESNF